jgi:NAD(P)-dependent dehydrogenase (short-subunit alcohol dehydrogenase family)
MGRELVLEALARGDKVIATARGRSFAKLKDLQEKGADTIELDITWTLDKLREVAREAIAIHGRVDVLVNNAAYMLLGSLEENTPEESIDQFNANVFGALNTTRAFLPHMRERRTGTVVFIGSVVGWQSWAYGGVYAASKWALRGISQTLHDEISPFGLRSTCVNLGYFRTPVLSNEQRPPKVSRITDYEELADKVYTHLEDANMKQPGDPVKGAKVIVDLVKGTDGAAGKSFPVSLALGTDSYEGCKRESEQALQRLEEWKEVSGSTDFS